MGAFIENVTKINDAVGSFVWGKGVFLLIGVGLIMTCVTGFFQITHIGHWLKKTVGGVFSKSSHNKKEKGSVSQFQALCTALAATIGTGNIAGVSAAIFYGGPGAIFWMWLAAFFGMMTNFSENTLGIFFRRKNKEGEWSGGAMYYLQDGLGGYNKVFKVVGKVLAIIFALFAILASFGIGNMGQVNNITGQMCGAFFSDKALGMTIFNGNVKLVPFCIGAGLIVIASLIILGGLKRIAAVAEKIVPVMALVYIIGAIIICCINIASIPAAFAEIFKFAFGVKAVTGGFIGIAVKEVITQGCKRGVFSNEAGLGSSVMVHSNSDVKEPVKQGLWGIFEVFADTFVVCTMTAMVVLTSGLIDLSTGQALVTEEEKSLMVSMAFGNVFGRVGVWFIAIATLLFAFTTVLGWSHYGSKAVEYIAGVKVTKIYKIIFVVMIMAGALMENTLAWDISDTFNGLMMVPNLIGVISLAPLVYKITRNYVDRKLKGKNVEPILSYDPEIQKEHAELVKNGAE